MQIKIELKSWNIKLNTLISKDNHTMKEIADYCLEIPNVPECLTPIVAAVPLQLLAYYIAINKGKDVDRPRNLAKSVTVE